MSERFVSRYQLKEEIGRGGMGKVFRAFDEQLQRHVAVKLIAGRDLENPQTQVRFRREAQAASSLNHPNICTIHDFGEHQGTPFFVMELVEGRSLEQVLQQESIHWKRAVEITSQIAEGLQAAHDSGVVHRDIKPGNIILTPSGSVKILDFGIAKLSESDETIADGTSLTRSGSLVGTVRYCSPEQALGKGLDHRSDLFSLGLVLYEMVSGAHPFEGDTQASQIDALLNHPPAPLPTGKLDVPPALQSLLERLLSKDPEGRPKSAREVVEALRDLEREDAGSASLPKAGWQRSAALAMALVSLFLLALLLVWSWNRPGGVPQREDNLALLPLRYSGPEGQRSNATMFPALLAEAFRSSSAIAVAPFETSRQYDPTTDLANTRRELGVSWLLTGAMTVTDPIYTMRLELSQEEQQAAWAREYRGELADLFSMAATVSSDVAEVLGQDSLANSGLLGLDRTVVKSYMEGQRYLEGWDVESNAERARQAFSEAVSLEPEFGEAQAGLALALWRVWQENGDPETARSAQQAAQQAVASSPSHPDSHLAMGIVQLGRGQFEEAFRAFQRAQALAPADDAVCRNIADAYARLERPEEAEQMYRQAISLRPDVWQNHRALGNFLLSRGRFHEAKESYRHIIRLRPQSDIGHNNLALSHLSLGEWEEAEVHLLAATAIQPTLAGHTNLGFVYYSTGRYQEAAEQFIEATRFSRDESAWANLGDAYRQLGQAQSAVKAYEQAIVISRSKLAIDPDDPELRSRLGYSLAGIGNCEGALRELEQTRENLNQAPWIAYYNAVSYALCGAEERAGEALVRAIEAGFKADVETNPDLQALLGKPEVRAALSKN